jgi:hypothetical protein
VPARWRIAAALAAAGAGAACGRPRPQPVPDPPEGIAIAVYAAADRAFAVIDDRRTIEVTGRRILLDRIERSAALPTLVIEPLGAARGVLRIEQCAREQLRFDPAEAPRPPRPAKPADEADSAALEAAAEADGVPSPLVACTVAGPPGRHRVRVHYVAAPYRFEARHEIAMTAPDRATVSTRFIAPTPAWGARGELVLHDGAPGGGEPPREVGRAVVTLDGGTAVISQPPREVPARLVHLYNGMALPVGIDRSDVAWGKDSQHDVAVLLELDDPQLLPAPAHVRIALGGGDVRELGTRYTPEPPAAAPETALALDRRALGQEPPPPSSRPRTAPARPGAAAAGPKRLPLWLDPLLRGTRKRTFDRAAGGTLADRVEITVANTGAEPREVWIEEPLRTARRREIVRARPGKPEIAGDVARMKVVVPPGQIERLAFTVRYTF